MSTERSFYSLYLNFINVSNNDCVYLYSLSWVLVSVVWVKWFNTCLFKLGIDLSWVDNPHGHQLQRRDSDLGNIFVLCASAPTNDITNFCSKILGSFYSFLSSFWNYFEFIVVLYYYNYIVQYFTSSRVTI